MANHPKPKLTLINCSKKDPYILARPKKYPDMVGVYVDISGKEKTKFFPNSILKTLQNFQVLCMG